MINVAKAEINVNFPPLGAQGNHSANNAMKACNLLDLH
jgi:hypothetical protein